MKLKLPSAAGAPREPSTHRRYQDSVSRVLRDTPPHPHDIELQSVAIELDRLEARLVTEARFLAQRLTSYASQLSKGAVPTMPGMHSTIEATDATFRARVDELTRLARVTGGKERVARLQAILDPEDLPSTCPCPATATAPSAPAAPGGPAS